MVAYKLYYSQKCKFSRYFITLLEKYPDVNIQFKRICIDKNIYGQIDNRVIQDIEIFKLKGVPCIIVDDQVHLGTYAFKWLDNYKTSIHPIHSSINKQDYSDAMQYQYQNVDLMSATDNTLSGVSGLDESKDTMYSLNNTQVNKRAVIGTNNMQQIDPQQDMKNEQLPSIKCNAKNSNESLDMIMQEYSKNRQKQNDLALNRFQ